MAIRVKLDPVPDCLIQALVAQDAEVRIHIDDFGAGFTGLQSVRSIPAHAVKIDRSLVRSLHDDPASVAVVRSVVGLASDLGMDVIAEGVESEADEHALLRLGVRRFQGYHVGRPGPEETLVVHGVHPASQTVVVMPAPRLQDEVGRLAELHRTGIMDSGRDDRFDTLVSLAAEVCDTPAAILTFVDEDRQWFKASVGVTRSESPRDWSFAAHGLAADGLFTVCDTHADARFASSPLVVGEPFVRSYAGAPLRTSTGHVLGMLCVIDRRPRSLTPHQQRMLQALADQAIALLELRVLSSARPASGGRRSATARHCVIACA